MSILNFKKETWESLAAQVFKTKNFIVLLDYVDYNAQVGYFKNRMHMTTISSYSIS